MLLKIFELDVIGYESLEKNNFKVLRASRIRGIFLLPSAQINPRWGAKHYRHLQDFL